MDLIKIRRGNVILRIKPSEKDRYLNMGYAVIGENGAVIEETAPTDVGVLQTVYRKYKELKSEHDALLAEYASVVGELKELKAASNDVAEPAKKSRAKKQS